MSRLKWGCLDRVEEQVFLRGWDAEPDQTLLDQEYHPLRWCDPRLLPTTQPRWARHPAGVHTPVDDVLAPQVVQGQGHLTDVQPHGVL